MRGQLSLELLIVILIFISVFLLIVPQIDKIKVTGDYALNLRNAELILNKIYFACERVTISGVNETLEIYSLTNYSVSSDGSKLAISFKAFNETKNISREIDFPCEVNLNLTKGKNKITIFG